MPDAVYVLDANVFIEASRRYYALDFAPMFWETLVDRAGAGRVVSIDRVPDELKRGADKLWEWAEERFRDWFVSTDDSAVLGRYRHVVTSVQAQRQFTDPAKAEFLGAADGWLVACGLARGYVVVTHEAASPGVKTRVPIPNVCRALGVPCIDTFQMLRELGVRWT